jgi:hypothetical protein
MPDGKQRCVSDRRPPGSGSFYLPLVEDGKNVEEFEIVEERQVTLNDMEDHTGGRKGKAG